MSDYDQTEARAEYIARMRAEGFEPSFPADDELQIDIDSEQAFELFQTQLNILIREMGVMRCTINVSASGFPNRHVRVQLPFPVDKWQRIAWQAALGSDPVRELLSCVRAQRGEDHPTMFVERVQP